MEADGFAASALIAPFTEFRVVGSTARLMLGTGDVVPVAADCSVLTTFWRSVLTVLGLTVTLTWAVFTPTLSENSEVFPLGSVAVAAMNWPDGTDVAKVAVKLALPLPSVEIESEPRNCCPWPKPVGVGRIVPRRTGGRRSYWAYC